MTTSAWLDYHSHLRDAQPFGVRAALPVAGGPHKGAARAVNWVMGRGRAIVVDGPKEFLPAFNPGSNFPYDFRYWTFRGEEHSDLYLQLCISAYYLDDYSGASVVCGIQIPIGGTEQLIGVGGQTAHYTLRVPVSPAETFGEFSFRLTPYGAAPVPDTDPPKNYTAYLRIHGVLVFEAPVQRLAHSIGDGCDIYSYDTRAPIYDGTADAQSIAQLSRAAQRAKFLFHRGGVFNWCHPPGRTTTSASYVDLYEAKPSLQVPKMVTGASLGFVHVYVYAKVSAGTGDVRFTMTNGDTLTISLTATTAAWLPSGSTLDVTRDVPSSWSSNGGFSSRDEMRVEWRCSGGGTLTLYAISVVNNTVT